MLGDKVINDKSGPITDPAQRAEALGAVTHAFIIMAGLLFALTLFVLFQRGRIAKAAAGIGPTPQASVLDALKSRWAVLGALAIGLYVGAEVSIGSIMINFLNQKDILGLPFEVGGQYLANIYWTGALVGRFIGSFLLTRIAAPRLLTICAMMAAILCAVAFTTTGPVAAYAALGVGLFNSIMFPTIFTITLERSGVSQSSTSGLLCLAIVGGAVLPMLVGRLADTISLNAAFIVPLFAYLFIMAFAWKAISARVFGSAAETPTLH
jgi:FHS family L-fucose permease-like MFS transporter